jgi:hypothetical protein
MKSYSSLYVLRKDQKAQTPDWILKWTTHHYGKYFDPCPAKPPFDGLSINWGKVNFVNPPFDNISKWIDKAVHETKTKDYVSIFLIPFRPHTEYMRRSSNYIKQCLVFDSRIAFKNYDTKLPHCMCICIIANKIPNKSLYGVKYVCKGYLDDVKDMKYFLKNKKNIHLTLSNNISKTLTSFMKKNEKTECSFLSPTRLDNKVLFSILLKCSYICFAGFSKFIGGTCMVYLNSNERVKLPYLKLYSFQTSNVRNMFK